MLKKILDRLKDEKMTKSEKRIAEFFIEKRDKLFLYSSAEIGKELALSDTSIIRFVKRLGYSNYTQFKQNINAETSLKIRPAEKLMKNAEVLASNHLELDFMKVIESNIHLLFRDNQEERFSQMEKFIKKARKKIVVGFKSSSGLAAFLGLRLGYIFEEVATFSMNSSEVIKAVYDMGKGDCLIIIGFPKYSRTYEILIETAAKREGKIIIITDSITSPYYGKGDLTISVPLKGLSFFNSLICGQIFVEYLLTYLTKNLDKAQKERIQELDELLSLNS